MWMPSFLKHSRLLTSSPEELSDESPAPPSKALRLLGAERLNDARRQARHVLKRARQCPSCTNLLSHLFDRLGSTLFLDDDPVALTRAFEAEERDAFSARVLAACIVLSGRERVVSAGVKEVCHALQ